MRADRSMLFALLLIAVGVVLLLQELEVIPDEVSVWPIVVIGVGAAMLVERVARGGAWGSSLIFPLVLVGIGAAFLLRDTGVVDEDRALAPLVVIAVGVGLVLGALPSRPAPASDRTVPLDGAERARVEIEHAGGSLRIGAHIGGANLLEGRLGGGADLRVRRDGGRLEVDVRPSGWRFGFPWEGHGPLDWPITLARAVPIELAVTTGSGRADLDLTDLRVEDLIVQTGASRLTVKLPSAGRPAVRIRGGATEVKVVVPSRMAARIRTHTGALARVRIDAHRFPPAAIGEYASPRYDEAEDRAEIAIEVGAATVDVG